MRRLHWFWRATIAIVLGGVLGTPFIVQIGKFEGPIYRITQWILDAVDHPIWGPFGIWLPMFVIAAIPVAAGVAVYGLLTRLYGPRTFSDETYCRKCGYILRGITEPRCPECGEKI